MQGTRTGAWSCPGILTGPESGRNQELSDSNGNAGLFLRDLLDLDGVLGTLGQRPAVFDELLRNHADDFIDVLQLLRGSPKARRIPVEILVAPREWFRPRLIVVGFPIVTTVGVRLSKPCQGV